MQNRYDSRNRRKTVDIQENLYILPRVETMNSPLPLKSQRRLK